MRSGSTGGYGASRHGRAGRLAAMAALALCLPGLGSAADAPAAPAPGMLLVASGTLDDPNFRRSVVLLLRTDHHGAMGLIINRPMANAPLLEMPELPDVPQLETLRGPAALIHQGGPLVMRHLLALVRSTEPLQRAWTVLDDVWVTPDIGQLEGMTDFEVRDDGFRAYVGYAGWGPGQLQAELAGGSWHLVPARAEHIFTDEPETLWSRLSTREAPRFVQWQERDGPARL